VVASDPAQIFIVNSTGDAPDSDPNDGVCDDGTGNCTLRAAIMQSNVSGADVDEIRFSIGSGVQTITPASPLPPSHPAVIDGTTQPGFSGTPIIELDGSNAGSDAIGIWGGPRLVVRGLVINRFATGIQVNSSSMVEGCFIGTDVTGTAALGNSVGVQIGVASIRIGGVTAEARNLISGNGTSVLAAGDSLSNFVTGNFIGTDVTGTSALGGSQIGVLASGRGFTIERNVISGNVTGVTMASAQSGPIVRNNFIGTDITGTIAIGNTGDGVLIEIFRRTVQVSARAISLLTTTGTACLSPIVAVTTFFPIPSYLTGAAASRWTQTALPTLKLSPIPFTPIPAWESISVSTA
jgi:CSLREA domain-containing protein